MKRLKQYRHRERPFGSVAIHLSKPLKHLWIAASRCALLTLLAMTISGNIARADPYTYAPDHCEFTITFPQEPQIENRCEIPQTQERCYDLVTFTQTYGLEATVDFRVICNPIDEDINANYSDAIIGATLREMTKDEVKQTFQSNVYEGDGYKLAGIVGEGERGMTPTIFMAQLWIGDASAFSFEAEITGDEHEEADQLLQSVLKSIHHKTNYEAAKDKPEQDKEAEE